MVTRVGLVIISAILIGVTFEIWRSRQKVLTGRFAGFMCSCGCYEEMETMTSQKDKINLFILHSQAEFFDVGK
ncbi:hypothetical protein GC105_04000 [Alkalibaculum sp. M08DMB]|uniref:Uncharacterized protein n=1 Tax=Alkalibaculum sporogenes TaxID=2655001 RepID=A0A6A7K6A1_9FIRM|nr:hypothetical protein [Alkalibaculum sporogenes]MPW24950.1 hypothetical protein [Alkalibaculum sporogenes]